MCVIIEEGVVVAAAVLIETVVDLLVEAVVAAAAVADTEITTGILIYTLHSLFKKYINHNLKKLPTTYKFL